MWMSCIGKLAVGIRGHRVDARIAILASGSVMVYTVEVSTRHEEI